MAKWRVPARVNKSTYLQSQCRVERLTVFLDLHSCSPWQCSVWSRTDQSSGTAYTHDTLSYPEIDWPGAGAGYPTVSGTLTGTPEVM